MILTLEYMRLDALFLESVRCWYYEPLELTELCENEEEFMEIDFQRNKTSYANA